MKIEIASNQLTEDEVRERLQICKDNEGIVDELYNFGQALMRHVVEDVQRIDLKAASLAAYCGAIITLLVSTQGTWSKVANAWVYLFITASAFSSLVAAILCVHALRLQKFEWISQKEWLHPDCLVSLGKLKQYRVLTMWGVIKSHRDVHLGKTRNLIKAQRFLVAAIVFLFIALVAGLWHYNLNHGFGLTFW